jgi:CHAT domain-containing protein
MIAGAENLLMTLWPVADETTAKIMTDFYKEAFATGDAPGSLAKVQRDWLVKLRQERGLLAAVREAGPFAMVTMTNPNAQREFVGGQINEKQEAPTLLETKKSDLNAKQQIEDEELKKVQSEIKKLKEDISRQPEKPTSPKRNISEYDRELDKAKAEKQKLEKILKQAKETAILSN